MVKQLKVNSNFFEEYRELLKIKNIHINDSTAYCLYSFVKYSTQISE